MFIMFRAVGGLCLWFSSISCNRYRSLLLMAPACFPKNEPQRHPVSHPMGSSVSLPDCKFDYKNLNINKGVRKAPEPL